ncbi:MAG: hypothetical protein ACI8Y7_000408 [Candidatus Woesearchaeota archaeon]|jgi:hypothetical protein
MDVLISTSRKGGNPGGWAALDINGEQVEGYLKYCPGARLPPAYQFSATHQPIYEALTYALAKKIGLHTPSVHIIGGHTIIPVFQYTDNIGRKDKLKETMPFYHFSVNMPEDSEVDQSELEKRVEADIPYLDFLIVDDVVGRRQNYIADKIDGITEPGYIDLGHSFVRAAEGIMTVPHKYASLKQASAQKAMKRRMKHTFVVMKNQNVHYNLNQFIEEIPDTRISMLENGVSSERKIHTLLREEECETIMNLYLEHMFNWHNIYNRKQKSTEWNRGPITLKS